MKLDWQYFAVSLLHSITTTITQTIIPDSFLSCPCKKNCNIQLYRSTACLQCATDAHMILSDQTLALNANRVYDVTTVFVYLSLPTNNGAYSTRKTPHWRRGSSEHTDSHRKLRKVTTTTADISEVLENYTRASGIIAHSRLVTFRQQTTRWLHRYHHTQHSTANLTGRQ